MLRCTLDGGASYFAAGVPWFVALFGRDSIITALQTLAYDLSIAEHTIRLLAKYQGKELNPWREEEPGKILHELRVGEMAHLGEIPHTPYYGTVDATPLWLVLVGKHATWSGETRLFDELRPQIEAALNWIEQYGNADGDGYVKYDCKIEKGLANQGWKDSGDGIVNADGSLAEPPIALVEVQGYVYQAKIEMAALFRRVGEEQAGVRTGGASRTLAGAFRSRFLGRRRLLRARHCNKAIVRPRSSPPTPGTRSGPESLSRNAPARSPNGCFLMKCSTVGECAL